jgi:hypothetical protein
LSELPQPAAKAAAPALRTAATTGSTVRVSLFAASRASNTIRSSILRGRSDGKAFGGAVERVVGDVEDGFDEVESFPVFAVVRDRLGVPVDHLIEQERA